MACPCSSSSPAIDDEIVEAGGPPRSHDLVPVVGLVPTSRAARGGVVRGDGCWGRHHHVRVTSWQEDRIGSALRGENPTVMARLPASFAVIGDVQWLPGYSVLLVDRLGVDQLSDLSRTDRLTFLSSMERLGDAVERACAEADPAFRRVNLEILGNADPFLHAHVWPRYGWEPPELVRRPVWLYPPDRWRDRETALGPRHDSLRNAITANLTDGARRVGQRR